MPGGIYGRDAELSVLDEFLTGLPLAPAALVLTGGAGAGKTTLLRAGVERAAALGYTVLRTQPSPSDMRLAFAGLADLLDAHLDVVLARLQGPQRRALGVALLVDDAPQAPPEPRVIAAAFRSALLVLAESAPVVVVVDDIQWLDAPTASAASFALRRLEREPVGLLCAQRREEPQGELPLELGRARLSTQAVALGGLSLGALHHLLRTRLGVSFSHPTLRRVHAESAGNPFIALEIVRTMRRRGITRLASGPLPVPDTVGGLVGERLRELPAPVTEALRLVAVMPDAPLSRYLAAGVPDGDLDAGVTAGVVEVDSGRLRFSHPLLASAVLGTTPPARRRELHLAAANTAADPEEKARHIALATATTSAQIAAGLDDAARAAELRGAPAAAAELLELAASLTPGTHLGDRHRRLLAAGRLLHIAGETRAAAALLDHLAQTSPPGPQRAEALAHLGWNSEEDFEASTRLLEEALAEAGEAAGLRASIHFFLSDHWAIRGNIERAAEEAHFAVADAERADEPALLASGIAQAFFFDWMCGHQTDERQLDRALDLERQLGSVGSHGPPSEAAGLYLMGMGRLDEARAALERALARAEAEGVEYVRADVLLRLSVIASQKGDPLRGAELARAGLDIAEQLVLEQLTSALLFGCGFAALQRGQPAEVTEAARRGLELSRAVGERVYLVCHEWLLGALDLALGNFAAAAARLRPLAGQLPSLGRRPNSQSIATDAIEALIGAGELDEAASLLAATQQRYTDPITSASAARCRGLLAAARGDPGEAVTHLDHAVELQAAMTPQPVQLGRTLLALGSMQRRLKQRRAARETLTEAIRLFQGAGAALWAARAEEELARVSGRAPSIGELTATELRVAELIAQGMSNRAAAAELFVTVRAIESTLTKIYAKLGVRSRTQLASHLRDRA
ncbi:MAG TPA: AAA family ATPase [Streptosporangiaceae bacterium]|nr:AAA family ATPase [Streptosporangiaceae bacterium]